MTNKKFKLAAMSLATAVAVSTVGPSASAVTYYLGNGSVTVDQDKDGNGAYSYQIRSMRMVLFISREATGHPLIIPTMAQRKIHLRIMPHNPPMLLATTQRTTPRLRPQPQTPSRSKRM